MTADARRFIYPLEVVRSRAQWQLNTLLGELATANRRVAATTDGLSRLRREHDTLAAEAAPRENCHVDPERARCVLVYLADVRHRMQSVHLQLDTLNVLRSELLQRARDQEVRLDALDRHRGTCLREHVARSTHQEAIEDDDQWLARLRWRALAIEKPPASPVTSGSESGAQA